MKRYDGLWPSIVDFGNLVRAMRNAVRGARRTIEVQSFLYMQEMELLRLKRELEAGSYTPGSYRTFEVRDPKPRLVSAAPFRDRVVHHAVCDALEPVLDRIYSDSSYACRKGKGAHKAVSRAGRFLRRHGFFLKCDIRKFFDSVNHGILIETIEDLFCERRLLDLLHRVITHSVPGCLPGRGLAIGNLTSQHFANLYLTVMDNEVLSRLRPSGYVRYMDDFVLFDDSLDALHGHRYELEVFLRERLELQFKPGDTFAASRSHGLPFLGFQLFPSITRVQGKSLRRMRRKIHLLGKENENARLDSTLYSRSMCSYFGHLSKADSLVLRRALCDGIRVSGE